jgi:poly(A) polymerase
VVTASSSTSSARILSRPDHPISRKAIHPNALKVLYRLQRSKQLGYLVGGAVRDHMLERQPKDYDIVTEARPPQIRRLFRNSRIIGRRFRLVHVYFREGIVEVSTFRRDPDPESQRSAPGELLITDDNVFGSPREDAFRRDFTVNALFYNIADFSVIDYVGGVEDLYQRQIRAIGDPDVRFQEDPVRMMRACELAGRLDFTIERQTQEALYRNRKEIDKASPARLLEELSQLLRSGRAAPAMQWMLELGLLEHILPELAEVATADSGVPYHRTLLGVDQLAASGRDLADSTLIAALLLPGVSHELAVREQGGQRRLKAGARRELVAGHADRFAQRFRISRVRADRLTDALLAAHRLGERGWKLPERIRFSQRAVFEDALPLFELLVEATGTGGEELEAWQGVASSRPAREKKARRPPQPRKRRRRRRR